jgi:hypothetical protein
MKICSDCKFCVFLDYGYSNYTVEGTSFNCAEKVHPDGQFDRFYGLDKRLEFAAQCNKFEPGEAIEMDCDREGLVRLTIEQQAIYDRATK